MARKREQLILVIWIENTIMYYRKKDLEIPILSVMRVFIWKFKSSLRVNRDVNVKRSDRFTYRIISWKYDRQ